MFAVRLLFALAACAAAQNPASSGSRAGAREIRLAREAEARVSALADRAKDGDEKSFLALVGNLSSPKFEVRMRALGALDRVGNRASIQHVAPLVDDPSPFVRNWGSVSILAMWDLAQLTREGPAPAAPRRLLARACSAVWRRTEPGRLWDACARWTDPSFAPPPERQHIDKDRAYWRYWWRAHHAEYENMTFAQGRSSPLSPILSTLKVSGIKTRP